MPNLESALSKLRNRAATTTALGAHRCSYFLSNRVLVGCEGGKPVVVSGGELMLL